MFPLHPLLYKDKLNVTVALPDSKIESEDWLNGKYTYGARLDDG